MTEQNPPTHNSPLAPHTPPQPVRRIRTFVLRLVVDVHDDWRGQISEPGSGDDWRSTFVGVEAFWAVMAEQLENACLNPTLHLDGDMLVSLSQDEYPSQSKGES